MIDAGILGAIFICTIFAVAVLFFLSIEIYEKIENWARNKVNKRTQEPKP